MNELLNQMVRAQVGEATARIREYYMARAFFSTDTQTTIDDLLAELDDEELEEAPLKSLFHGRIPMAQKFLPRIFV